MLHFLIGLAVLLWIVIQLTYFVSAIRTQRMVARALAPPPGGYTRPPQYEPPAPEPRRSPPPPVSDAMMARNKQFFANKAWHHARAR